MLWETLYGTVDTVKLREQQLLESDDEEKQ